VWNFIRAMPVTIPPALSITATGRTAIEQRSMVESRDFLFRYKLARKDDRWWIRDNKERSSKKNEKWKPDIL
jgi:hypothetical protein